MFHFSVAACSPSNLRSEVLCEVPIDCSIYWETKDPKKIPKEIRKRKLQDIANLLVQTGKYEEPPPTAQSPFAAEIR